MRKTLPKYGARRIRSWFAWSAVRIDHEERWLERVTVDEEFVRGGVGDFWQKRRFVDRAA